MQFTSISQRCDAAFNFSGNGIRDDCFSISKVLNFELFCCFSCYYLNIAAITSHFPQLEAIITQVVYNLDFRLINHG